jgi:hypothetical protein
MDGIEFRVPRQDHIVVEDFLATSPGGVLGIQLEITNLDRHSDVASTARNAGKEVTVDPMTERLCHVGFAEDRVPFAELYPIDQLTLARSASARATLAERLIDLQRPHATAFTPANFFVADSDDVGLNLAMVHQTRALVPDEEMRPILAVDSRYLAKKGEAAALARAYRDAGARRLELRISPLGGHDMGPIKVRNTLAALAAFKAAGLDVLLAESGLIGHAATALDLAGSFSVGVGYWEKYDHKTTVSRQVKNAEPSDESDASGPRGAQANVYLPGAEIAVPRKMAKVLYGSTSVRSRLGCGIGKCSNAIDGPLLDVRGHYLHSQSSAVEAMLDQPPAWRPTLLRDRFDAAIRRREELWKALPADVIAPKSKTLTSLVDEVDRRRGQKAA